MKISKVAILILGIGIFAIAFASLYMVYNQKKTEQTSIKGSIAVAQAAIPMMAADKNEQERLLVQSNTTLSELDRDIAGTENLLTNTQATFPEKVESIEYDEELFRVAESWSLSMVKISTGDPTQESISATGNATANQTAVTKAATFSSYSFKIQVSGQVSDILSFFRALTTNPMFNTTTVASVQMHVPEPPTDQQKQTMTLAEIAAAGTSSATADVTVYGYKGG